MSSPNIDPGLTLTFLKLVITGSVIHTDGVSLELSHDSKTLTFAVVNISNFLTISV
jgi:hypothetical protein